MFFKRLSRSRTNSYVDEFGDPPTPASARKYTDEKYDRPPSSRQSNAHGQPSPIDPSDEKPLNVMYPRQAPIPDTHYGNMHQGRTMGSNDSPNGGHISNGGNASIPMQRTASGFDATASPAKLEAAPDLLTRAFHEAVRPYTDKIDQLEGQLADLQSWADQLEQQQKEIYQWIDKRGLRPDVPPLIAKAMDSQPTSADTLNAQLDRKITIVNFDLHRLQDDLNDSISASHFASAMAKFLPDIQRLSLLQAGPRYAFDLILKLGGNLNSHGGVDPGDPDDLAARRSFYAKLDEHMVEVVRRRFSEGEDWPVPREIKRIEKTGAYLKNYGIEPYFPETLELMKREMSFRGQSNPPTYQ